MLESKLFLTKQKMFYSHNPYQIRTEFYIHNFSLVGWVDKETMLTRPIQLNSMKTGMLTSGGPTGVQTVRQKGMQKMQEMPF